MENKGLIFIPDISGFSRFISETEIDHSRLIIQELLEILINANTLGLEISEIEGDAILFYKFGSPPQLKELYKQVENMFCAFHRNLISYEHRRYCQCQACMSAIHLSLKVITHYGEFTQYNVKNFNKLIGKDIIVAHQLLKNDIDNHEYWLITKNLLQGGHPSDLTDGIHWHSSAKQTESGEVRFQYTPLSQLKATLSPALPSPPDLSKKAKVISVSREYDTDIITLFHATGDFTYRPRWQEDVKGVKEVDHFLPRVGMRCRCVMDSGEVVVSATSYYYENDRIEFSETEESSKSATCFTLEKIQSKKTRLTIDFYINKSLPHQLLFAINRKRKMEINLQKSLDNLTGLVRELRIPSAVDA